MDVRDLLVALAHLDPSLFGCANVCSSEISQPIDKLQLFPEREHIVEQNVIASSAKMGVETMASLQHVGHHQHITFHCHLFWVR